MRMQLLVDESRGSLDSCCLVLPIGEIASEVEDRHPELRKQDHLD